MGIGINIKMTKTSLLEFCSLIGTFAYFSNFRIPCAAKKIFNTTIKTRVNDNPVAL